MQRVHCAISETTHELFSNTTEYTNPLPTHVWVTGSLVTLFHRVTAAIAEGKRPVPFRTRKLSPPAPMVLHSTGCGRVGHRRTQLHNPEHPRPHRGRGCSAFPTRPSQHPINLREPVPSPQKQFQLPAPALHHARRGTRSAHPRTHSSRVRMSSTVSPPESALPSSVTLMNSSVSFAFSSI
jgi:hypothetical protein